MGSCNRFRSLLTVSTFLVYGPSSQLDPTLIHLVGGLCNESRHLRRTRTHWYIFRSSPIISDGLDIFSLRFQIPDWNRHWFFQLVGIETSPFRLHSFVYEFLISHLPFVYQKVRFWFLATLLCRSSEIRLSEPYVGIILLFGSCVPVSCWYLLLAVCYFLVLLLILVCGSSAELLEPILIVLVGDWILVVLFRFSLRKFGPALHRPSPTTYPETQYESECWPSWSWIFSNLWGNYLAPILIFFCGFGRLWTAVVGRQLTSFLPVT